MTHYEIERKYLIDLPDERFLAAQPDCAVWDIEQIYLLGEPGETRRIRRVVENGQTRCYQTTKRRVAGCLRPLMSANRRSANRNTIGCARNVIHRFKRF